MSEVKVKAVTKTTITKPRLRRIRCQINTRTINPQSNHHRTRAAAAVQQGYRAMKWFFREGPTDGYEGMKKLLALKNRPTAVFAANDLMALGAMTAIREANLRIPDDIAQRVHIDVEVFL